MPAEKVSRGPTKYQLRNEKYQETSVYAFPNIQKMVFLISMFLNKFQISLQIENFQFYGR